MTYQLSTNEIIIISVIVPIIFIIIIVIIYQKYQQKILYKKRKKKLESTFENIYDRERLYGIKDIDTPKILVKYEVYKPKRDDKKNSLTSKFIKI
jgi:phosphate/sulfate permease